MELFVNDLSEQSDVIMNVKDHLGRTLLHKVVEQQKIFFVECVLGVGCNLNEIETWGATPFTIAVLMSNKELCQLLISRGLRVTETLS